MSCKQGVGHVLNVPSTASCTDTGLWSFGSTIPRCSCEYVSKSRNKAFERREIEREREKEMEGGREREERERERERERECARACVPARARARVCVCVHAFVRACVRACVRVPMVCAYQVCFMSTCVHASVSQSQGRRGCKMANHTNLFEKHFDLFSRSFFLSGSYSSLLLCLSEALFLLCFFVLFAEVVSCGPPQKLARVFRSVARTTTMAARWRSTAQAGLL